MDSTSINTIMTTMEVPPNSLWNLVILLGTGVFIIAMGLLSHWSLNQRKECSSTWLVVPGDGMDGH